ncbi:hypothetical protein BO78DRAFT_439582 [Aspergillus sclerotiicarbonarius CBS 121057]|uniref:Zn(2)-C6 fungal-type domain-containing protein n=1 Tax=Aspergillus sclerotiicarbonarius (strain CBS 121057 / IBT 28362) TaxID=1448318 RepID=A0A319DRK8_ASPSB|nr:hypothetical protein BO78DRAFT_439582 [Aspergillus sclerotiicarbonarius CBS 121057]
MFSTLRCGGGNEPIRIERQHYAHEVNIGRGPQHIACENCRLKKLRCNGKKPTCGRCREKSIQCQYGTGEPLSPSSMASDGTNRTKVTKSVKTPRTAREKRKGTPQDEVPESTQPIPVTTPQGSGSPQMLLMEDWLADEGMMGALQPAPDCDTALGGMSAEDEISPWGFTPYSPTTEPSREHLMHPTSIPQTLDLQGTRSSAQATTPAPLPCVMPVSASTSTSTSTSSSYIEPRLLRPRMMHLFSTDPFPPSHHALPNQPPADTRPTSSSSLGCHCWEEVANILQQIELKSIVSEQTSSLESRLSYQKTAVQFCTAMLECPSCRLCPERMMILAPVGNKLIQEYKSILEQWFQSLSGQNPHQVQAQMQMQMREIENTTRGGTPLSLAHPADGICRERIFLGDYEIDSSEWNAVIETLMALHYQRLEAFLVSSRTWATMTSRSAMLAVFIKLEANFRLLSMPPSPRMGGSR